MEIGFLFGLVLFVLSGLVMLNPANPVPNDLENARRIKQKLKDNYIWGNKEDKQ